MKTSSIHYITLNKIGYEKEIAIPTGKIEGDRAEVFCFMSRNPERKIWIQRSDIFTNQHVEQLKLL